VTSRIVGVIPTFAPGPALSSTVRVLVNQVDHVVLSDDASPCTSDKALAAIQDIENVTLIRHPQNRGIARGLNDGLHHAVAIEADWLLTLDQDTEIDGEYVAHLRQDAERRLSAGDRVGAIGTSEIADSAGRLRIPVHRGRHGDFTEELIQTGTLWSVPGLRDIGGFDESLGIDAVDAAACLRLRELGYTICVTPHVSIRHVIGTARIVRIFGHETMVTGHSAERRTTMLRNRLRLFPSEFRQSPRHAVRTLRRVATNQALGLVLESDRWRKARGSALGLLPSRDTTGN
jgi:rhamnosyltransferase